MDENLTPKEILERDGVYVASNPADRVPEEAEISNIIKLATSDRKEDRIVGTFVSSGFSISEDIAKSILKVYAPDKIDEKIDNYTIVTISSSTMLVARDKENICQFTVNLPQEVSRMTESPHFEERLEEFYEQSKTYASIRHAGYAIIIILALIVLGIYVLAYIFSGYAHV